MPELPEVETVKNALAPQLVGRKITKTNITLAKTVHADQDTFAAAVTGQTITALSRRGKYLTLHLNDGNRLIIHLRMTGCLIIVPTQTPTAKHTHVILSLDDGQDLRFEDSRGFGQWWYLPAGAPDTSGQQKLGPEPNAVTATYLQQKLGKRGTCVKTLLLDQTIVAGIGNIYSDEICWHAGILPQKPGLKLSEPEFLRLAQEISAQITRFSGLHRVDFATYMQFQGKSYQTDRYLDVYGRAGQPCHRCQQTLVGARLNGRSTVYCPHCQH